MLANARNVLPMRHPFCSPSCRDEEIASSYTIVRLSVKKNVEIRLTCSRVRVVSSPRWPLGCGGLTSVYTVDGQLYRDRERAARA
jgi:hypothetical protein